jgi:hypothetical protein
MACWRERTQRLDVILVKAPLDVLDHQASLPDLRVTDHTDLDDHAGAHQSKRRKDTWGNALVRENDTHLFFSSLFKRDGCAPAEEGPGVGEDEDEAAEADMDKKYIKGLVLVYWANYYSG